MCSILQSCELPTTKTQKVTMGGPRKMHIFSTFGNFGATVLLICYDRKQFCQILRSKKGMFFARCCCPPPQKNSRSCVDLCPRGHRSTQLCDFFCGGGQQPFFSSLFSSPLSSPLTFPLLSCLSPPPISLLSSFLSRPLLIYTSLICAPASF